VEILTTILAIETSCDETGVAVIAKQGDVVITKAAAVASQVDVHALTGGVVPEVAAREHVQVIGPLVVQVLREAEVQPGDLDGVAVTVGPGLIPALAVGVNAARALAYAWGKPLIPVHHLEGHIYSALLRSAESEKLIRQPAEQSAKLTDDFPVLALIVSGGHTMLVQVDGHLQYELLGTTRDDAAGEAFDKVARMLGLPYPGGPEVSRLAVDGDPAAFDFTRPMQHSGDLDVSFSGLKTEVLYTVRELSAKELAAKRADIAASFQQAVIDTLIGKTLRAMEQVSPAAVVLAGGVAANTALREQLAAAVAAAGGTLRVAPRELCGDNATMIGQVGVLAHAQGRHVSWQQIDAQARVSLESFSS